MAELEDLQAEQEAILAARKAGTPVQRTRSSGGLGGSTFDDELIKEILRRYEEEKYTLDPSMGKQRLNTPKTYNPGGGGVHFTGGSPFKVDKRDQSILSAGAVFKTLYDKGIPQSIGRKVMEQYGKWRAPKDTGFDPADYQTPIRTGSPEKFGNWKTGASGLDPMVLEILARMGR